MFPEVAYLLSSDSNYFYISFAVHGLAKRAGLYPGDRADTLFCDSKHIKETAP